jgi:hypothetical protein
MGIFSKVANTGSSTDWRVTKKVWAKVNSGWVAATGVFGKTISGWVKMWPGNAPSVRLSDPINIRLGGYNGTVATSPQLFSSTNQGTTGTFLKLWGNDGSFDGVTPITISNRRMLCSDNIDGQVERFSLSGNDTIDFATTTQATRDLAEGYYIFYQLLATNVDGSLDAYSPPIKVIKRKPALVSTALLSESGGTLTVSSTGVIELDVQVRWGWWIRPGGYLGGTPVLRWWKNTTRSAGGTLLKEIDNYVSGSYDPNYIYDIASNVLTIYNNIGGGNSLQSGEYIVAELYLENSYTAHYAAPAIYWAATGEAAIPTITSLTASAPTTSSTQLVTVTVNWSSTNQASFSCSVTQTGVASYTKYGSTQTSANQASSGSFFNVYSGASATILLRVYNGPPDSNGFPTGTYAESTITYTPPISLSKLSTPTGVNATDDRSDGVNVTWNSVSGAAYYGVWYGGAPGYDSLADFGGNRNTSLITGTSYLDTAISAGSSRDYYVQAYRSGDPSGTKSDWGGPNNGTRTGGITYGPCEYWYENTTYECSGTFNRNVTTTYYRRKIYVGGSWDGSSYDTSGCSSSTTYGSYVDAPYQYHCRTNYYQPGIPDDTYTSSSDESAVVCESYRTVCSFNNTGSYPSASNPPACPTTTWYCTESYPGGGVGNCGYSTYTYNNSASGSGFSRSCSTSGYPSCQSTNPAPVCISYKYVCKYYDAYNSNSNNYSTCYYEGECAANNNSDGSRSTCCAAYS